MSKILKIERLRTVSQWSLRRIGVMWSTPHVFCSQSRSRVLNSTNWTFEISLSRHNKWCWSDYTILHRGNDFPWGNSLAMEIKAFRCQTKRVFLSNLTKCYSHTRLKANLSCDQFLGNDDLAEFNDWFSVFNPIQTLKRNKYCPKFISECCRGRDESSYVPHVVKVTTAML